MVIYNSTMIVQNFLFSIFSLNKRRNNFPICSETFLVCCEIFPICCETFRVCCETCLVCCETFPVCCETFPVCCETFPVCCETFPKNPLAVKWESTLYCGTPYIIKHLISYISYVSITIHYVSYNMIHIWPCEIFKLGYSRLLSLQPKCGILCRNHRIRMPQIPAGLK